jgi:Long-chain acyl-CoA synthetases (AMP-forming)
MRGILERIAKQAAADPRHPALQDEHIRLDYGELQREVARIAVLLNATRIAVLMDNGSAWAVVDLAIAVRGAVAVPIPPFFSAGQVRHLLADVAPDLIVSDRPDVMNAIVGLAPEGQLEVAGRRLHLFAPRVGVVPALPCGTCKVTYTSGTTGQPRGVCLAGAAIEAATIALADAVQASRADRSLSLLPLSTLLENIGGIYAPLCSGSSAALPSLTSCGFSGSSTVQLAPLFAAFHRYMPSATILVPQLLKLLVECLSAGAQLPDSLRFVAVGGAPCSNTLIQRAWALGLPVHEGYGLSEAASVVSLNQPGRLRPGSVGTPLPGLQVRLAKDNEIIVANRLFEGYLGSDVRPPVEWPTGDLGRFDEDGYLYITGRKKTAYATAFGRNVAPEWVESELLATPTLLQATVFGEARARNVAVLVPHPGAGFAEIEAAVTAANAGLPDYARVSAWLRAETPFTSANGLARPSGAPDREAVARHYADALEALHASETAHVYP